MVCLLIAYCLFIAHYFCDLVMSVTMKTSKLNVPFGFNLSIRKMWLLMWIAKIVWEIIWISGGYSRLSVWVNGRLYCFYDLSNYKFELYTFTDT